MKRFAATLLGMVILAPSPAADPADLVKELETKWGAKVTYADDDPAKSVVEVLFHCTSDVPDEVIARLAAFPKLQKLGLIGGQKLTDTGLKNIAALKGLTDLNLRNSHVTAAGIKHLAGLPNLKSVFFFDVKLTTEAMKELEVFPALEELRLRNVNGPAEAAASLAKCKKLKLVDAFRCQGTFDPKGAAGMQAVLPGVEVKLRD
jgi:hypothetical protein